MTNAERHEELQQAVRDYLDLTTDQFWGGFSELTEYKVRTEQVDEYTALRGRLARLSKWNG